MNWQATLELAEHEVARILRELPAPVRERIRNIPILMEKCPADADVESGIEADTLGLFDEGSDGLARIRLWLENIRDYAGPGKTAYIEEVRTTLLHEIGHALGWEEDDLDERGLG